MHYISYPNSCNFNMDYLATTNIDTEIIFYIYGQLYGKWVLIVYILQHSKRKCLFSNPFRWVYLWNFVMVTTVRLNRHQNRNIINTPVPVRMRLLCYLCDAVGYVTVRKIGKLYRSGWWDTEDYFMMFYVLFQFAASFIMNFGLVNLFGLSANFTGYCLFSNLKLL